MELSSALSRELTQQVLFTEEGATLTVLGAEEWMEVRVLLAKVVEPAHLVSLSEIDSYPSYHP